MRISSLNIKQMADGTKFKIFLSGGHWDDDFGKVKDVIKFGNKLYECKDFFYIEDMDDKDGYEFEVAINEYQDKLLLSDKKSIAKHDSRINSTGRPSLV